MSISHKKQIVPPVTFLIPNNLNWEIIEQNKPLWYNRDTAAAFINLFCRKSNNNWVKLSSKYLEKLNRNASKYMHFFVLCGLIEVKTKNKYQKSFISRTGKIIRGYSKSYKLTSKYANSPMTKHLSFNLRTNKGFTNMLLSIDWGKRRT